ncbi:MAG: DUF72 domain-containing protein [Chloroflexota bacterium]
MDGRLYTGTSGFAYRDWVPTFYPPGTRREDLLRSYATRLAACELNNTYYRQPTPGRIAAWVAATPPGFRFTAKAQRGGSIRALLSDPGAVLPWLTAPMTALGERLGSVLFRVPAEVERDDRRLTALLLAWPAGLPLTIEFQNPSWFDDDVFALLRSAGAVLCATETDDDPEPPSLRLTGPFVYLRLRRTAYTPEELGAWVDRIEPFLRAGHDAFVFFRHDAGGDSALRAVEFSRRAEAALR